MTEIIRNAVATIATTILLAGVIPSNVHAQKVVPKSELPIGKIIAPEAGATVSRGFEVKGSVSGDFRNLWILVRVGDMYWPKEEIEPNAGQWKTKVREGRVSTSERFEVILADVSDSVRLMLFEARAVGERVGTYPPVHRRRLGSDMHILDSKEYKLE